MSNWYKQNEVEVGGSEGGTETGIEEKAKTSTVLRKEEQRTLESRATTWRQSPEGLGVVLEWSIPGCLASL